MLNQPEVLMNISATLGEGPHWEADGNVLYCVDIMEKRIYRHHLADGTWEQYDLDQYVGAVVPRVSGGLVVAATKGIYAFDPETGRLDLIAQQENQDPDLRYNDGKCDPAGRFWAGTTSLTNRDGQASFYRLDTDGTLHTMLEGVSISNGLCWSLDGTVMYYIDTPTKAVAAFDYDLDTGAIRNRRTIIEFAQDDGVPDGMTIDTEGKLWIAHWDGFQVSRWDPLTGRKLSTIQLPVPLVTSCIFGGAEGNELYITTARIGLSEEALRKYPLSGAVFRVVTDVKGTQANRYLG